LNIDLLLAAAYKNQTIVDQGDAYMKKHLQNHISYQRDEVYRSVSLTDHFSISNLNQINYIFLPHKNKRWKVIDKS